MNVESPLRFIPLRRFYPLVLGAVSLLGFLLTHLFEQGEVQRLDRLTIELQDSVVPNLRQWVDLSRDVRGRLEILSRDPRRPISKTSRSGNTWFLSEEMPRLSEEFPIGFNADFIAAYRSLVEMQKVLIESSQNHWSEILSAREAHSDGQVYGATLALLKDWSGFDRLLHLNLRMARENLIHLAEKREQVKRQTFAISLSLMSLLLLVLVVSQAKIWIARAQLQIWGDAVKSYLARLHQGSNHPMNIKDGLSRWPEMSELGMELKNLGITVHDQRAMLEGQSRKLEGMNRSLLEQNRTLRELGQINQRVLNALDAAILVSSVDGTVEQYNGRFFEWFLKDLSPQDRLGVHGKTMTALGQLCGFDFKPTETYRVWGERFWKVRGLPLYESSEWGFVYIIEDKTEESLADQKLRQAEKLTLAGQMSSQVAHELRNPINALNLQIELLREDLGDRPDLMRRIGVISEQVQRLDRLTEKYMGHGLAQHVKSNQSGRHGISIEKVIGAVLALLEPLLLELSIQVELSGSKQALCTSMDEDLFEQVLFNLLSNAVEALKETNLEKQKRVIQILWALDDRKRPFVRVVDNGPGVKPQLVQNLFQPFVSGRPDGHGLGLSLSKNICLQHGGDLKWEPTHQGACFVIHLPQVREESLEYGVENTDQLKHSHC